MKSILFLSLALSSWAFARETCVYTVVGDPKLQWRAFKFTERVGVAGSFSKLRSKIPASAPSLRKLIEETSVEIEPSSVSTGDVVRDSKVRSTIFAPGPQGEDGIHVRFLRDSANASDLAAGGTVKAAIEIQGRQLTLPMNSLFDEKSGVLTLSGPLNLVEFGLAHSLAQLETVCAAQHLGKDGVRKLWPDVEIKVEAQIQKQCSLNKETKVKAPKQSQSSRSSKIIVRAPLVKSQAHCCGV